MSQPRRDTLVMAAGYPLASLPFTALELGRLALSFVCCRSRLSLLTSDQERIDCFATQPSPLAFCTLFHPQIAPWPTAPLAPLPVQHAPTPLVNLAGSRHGSFGCRYACTSLQLPQAFPRPRSGDVRQHQKRRSGDVLARVSRLWNTAAVERGRTASDRLCTAAFSQSNGGGGESSKAEPSLSLCRSRTFAYRSENPLVQD